MNLFAQPALGANAEAVADNEHAQDQLRVNRGPPRVAVEGGELLPQLAQIEAPINAAQQMIGRKMRLKIERIEELILRTCLLSHHLEIPFVIGLTPLT
jgi:hypothetical protein